MLWRTANQGKGTERDSGVCRGYCRAGLSEDITWRGGLSYASQEDRCPRQGEQQVYRRLGEMSVACTPEAQRGWDGLKEKQQERQANDMYFRFHSENMGSSQEILGRGVLPGNRLWDGALQAGDLLSHDCKKVREAGLGRGRTCVHSAETSLDPAGSCGVGMTLQSVPRLRWRARPCKRASVAVSREGLQTLGEAAPFGGDAWRRLHLWATAVTTPASGAMTPQSWRGDLGGTPQGHYRSVQVLILITILQLRHFYILSETQGV